MEKLNLKSVQNYCRDLPSENYHRDLPSGNCLVLLQFVCGSNTLLSSYILISTCTTLCVCTRTLLLVARVFL